jgi:glycosyltransferase involved in cell wall biosynthesis
MTTGGFALTCAIDAQISPDVAGGTETALLSLIGALGRMPTEERFVVIGMTDHGPRLAPFLGPNQTLMIWPERYCWYTPAGARHRTPDATSRRKPGVWRRIGKLVAERHGTRRRADARLRPHGASVVHFPYPHHFPTTLPFVYEPWGLPHVHFPQHFAPGEPEWMDRLYRGGCEEAALVVTATRWVKKDIVASYGIAPEKVAVIPRVPAAPAQPAAPPAARPGLPADFALFPAMTWPTKNHIGLLRALARLRDAHGVKLHVVCTGRPYKPHWNEILAERAALKLGDQVHFLGAVSGAELTSLFRAARFLVFPSLFEGLGLPPLEAFQHGLPVVASNAGGIPEVVGEAALLFDPESEESLVGALLKAVREPGLLAELRARGTARLERFSPVKMAKMFVTCYRHAARAPLSEEQGALLSEMTAS